jgi:hypothetical protein
VRTWIRQHPCLSIFIALQAIDFSTTYLGLHFGAHEQNPFVLMLIQFYGLACALLLLKGFGALLGLKLGEGNKTLRRANWIYGAAMLWNVTMLTYHFMLTYHLVS